jgi:hypothetical protein
VLASLLQADRDFSYFKGRQANSKRALEIVHGKCFGECEYAAVAVSIGIIQKSDSTTEEVDIKTK